MNTSHNAFSRVVESVRHGLVSGVGTIWFLVRIMVPVSLAVSILRWSGALTWGAAFLEPVMRLLGLPGEASLVLASSMLLNVYSAIAVIETLSLTMREITILAIMSLVAHNLIVETAVMKKSGSSALKMVVIRIGWAFAAGFAFNLLLPQADAGTRTAVLVETARQSFSDMMMVWGLSTLRLVLKVVVLVLTIMVAQRLMEEFHVMDFLSGLTAPVMKIFGLPDSASFLWIVVNVVGYAYGAAVIVERVRNGKMTPQEADLFNHHAAVSHSMLEDTALYLAIGAPLFWVTVPRLLMALVIVWFERFRRVWFRRSFRAGSM